MKPYFVDQLPKELIELVKENHRKRIELDGFYTEEEINDFVEDLPNHKIVDLDDALDKDVYELIYSYTE